MALAAAKRAEEKQREQEEAAELRTILRTTARAEALMASAEARKKQEYIAQLNAQREEQAARYVRRVHTNMLWVCSCQYSYWRRWLVLMQSEG